MKILIVENEIYLASSIASKLGDIGYECEIVNSVKEALSLNGNFDTVLLSTTLGGQDFYPIIKKFKSSIIILMISYISADTVLKPIEAGAKDYIQKPFMIEELTRKIRHYEDVKNTIDKLKFYEAFTQNSLKSFQTDEYEYKKIKLPLLIKSPKIGYADRFVTNFMHALNKPFTLVLPTSIDELQSTINNSKKEHIYIRGIQNFSSQDVQSLLSACAKNPIIISTTDLSQDAPFEKISIATDGHGFSVESIATIDEYIKHIITAYQDRLPDTELAKRLGISRKSLWEKRKKYDLSKKK